ncbi:protein fem-1 homolog A-like [Hyalella azteca]|uniref:Protein fem-1 homolog A-like n=1 Tax=Hyalella azteca TaxID=294128 RepID=A0A8B7PQD9_HYAAZ|nr:protein fem-1 homolog A-like [Hyalella azteca]
MLNSVKNILHPKRKDELDAEYKRLFMDLMEQVWSRIPCIDLGIGGHLSPYWRHKIEKLPREIRQEIVNRKSNGCSPLFEACRRGLAEVVEYLCSTCGADVEQKGLYAVDNEKLDHVVTPLWCAAVAGHENVVKILIKHGANVNSVSDTGSTPIRSACYMSHIKIVQYLVASGADILKPNFNGGTCLINSVQSAELCQFLLDHGADINAQDIKNKTALHYAVEENRFETVKLLIEHGADPFLRSRMGDDALQTACLKGAHQVLSYMVKKLSIPKGRIADCYELMGSTFLDDRNDIHVAIMYWRRAVFLRKSAGVVKIVDAPCSTFDWAQEFISEEDLDSIIVDLDAIRIQSLLICMRVLGRAHKDTIYRLTIRGAAYADSHQFQRCIRLWLLALEIRILKDSILSIDVYSNSHAFVKLLLDMMRFPPEEMKQIVLFDDVFRVLKLIGDELESNMGLLNIQPVSIHQQNTYDQTLIVFLYLLYVTLRIEPTFEQMRSLTSHLSKIVQLNPVSVQGKMTLLHMSVTMSSLIAPPTPSSYPTSRNTCYFPDLKVASLLLDCGAQVNARSTGGCSPLYLASSGHHYRKEIVEMLLIRGAHMDQATTGFDHAGLVLARNSAALLDKLLVPVPSLKCLAARAIRRSHYYPVMSGALPQHLYSFIDLH